MGMSPVKMSAIPKQLPEKCVYLFSEGDQTLYVGRTRRLRQRLRQHSVVGAQHNQAVFAYRLDEEYAQLEKETGVPVDEIPIALTAFDEVFPIPNGWFRDPPGDARRVLILMPASMRGIGAYRRLRRKGVEEYRDLACGGSTAGRMAGDHNTVVRLLDCSEADLVK